MPHAVSQHPKSLRIFFMSEMWERYGFYVVQTLLVLYLTFQYKWTDEQAFLLVGSFTAMTYISSLAGGWIADHLLGQKRAIVIATLILMISYTVLAIFQTRQGLLLSLAGICVGGGLLKPNISSLLGNEYPLNSPTRESGFTLFYIGITTGIFLGSTIPNLIHQAFGWPIAFLSAAIGVMFAFFIFIYGIYRYQIQDYHPYEHTPPKLILTTFLLILLYSIVLGIFDFPLVATSAFAGIIFFCIGYIIYAAKSEKGAQSRQTIIIGLLCLISTFFWTFNFQMFSSFSLLVTRVVEPVLFHMYFPSPYYVAVQSVGLIVFGLMLARPRAHLSVAIHATHIGKKFLYAMILMSLAYTLTTGILYFNLGFGLLSPLLIIPVYLIISAAEILLSPVGLAAITLLSSPKRVSTMMGIFFVSIGTGAFLSGKLATLTAIPTTDASIDMLKHFYFIGFCKMLGLLLIATLFCFFVNLLIKFLLKDKS